MREGWREGGNPSFGREGGSEGAVEGGRGPSEEGGRAEGYSF